MKIYEFIRRHEKLVRRMTKAGMLSHRYIRAYDIYREWKKNGGNVDAVYSAAFRNGISERTVWRYIREMEREM